jgi:NAD(P) transhydrogenase subunit beta
MNVLLAEADVSYEQLVEPPDVNPVITNVDVAVVIGANDVVNPAAREEGTPLYGMPIIDVDRARVCIVLKRSLKAGFAGVDNPLFFAPNTRMLLGDAKESISGLVAEFKD